MNSNKEGQDVVHIIRIFALAFTFLGSFKLGKAVEILENLSDTQYDTATVQGLLGLIHYENVNYIEVSSV